MSEAALRALGWSLADASLYVLVLTLAAASVRQVVSRRRALLRYAVTYAALMLCLPLAALCAAEALVRTAQPGVEITPAIPAATAVRTEEVAWKGHWLGTCYRARPSARSWTDPIVALADPLMPWAAATWLAGVAAVALWHLGGSQHVRRLLRRSHPAPAALSRRLAHLSSGLRLADRVRLVASSEADVPMVVGVWRPTIVLPDRLLGFLDRRSLESLLVHELAHVRRRDPLANWVQAIAEALLFFHPAAWWLSRVARQEREHCCDDITVRLVRDELLYARSLLGLQEARSLWPQRAVAATGAAFALRIERLCGKPEQPLAAPRRRGAAALAASGTAAALSLALLGQGAPLPFTAIAAAPLAAAALDVGLMAHYPFDGDARDVSGQGHTGLVQGAVLTADRFGRPAMAYDFDGQRARIVAPTSGALDSAGSVSVSAWVLPRSHGAWESWAAKSDGGEHSQWRVGLGVVADEWGFTEYTQTGKGPSWQNYWLSGSPLPLGVWSHVVMVLDAPRREVTLYRDGARLASFASVEPPTARHGQLFVGFQTDDDAYFDGKIDELRIYARTLSAAEVRALYRERS